MIGMIPPLRAAPSVITTDTLISISHTVGLLGLAITGR